MRFLSSIVAVAAIAGMAPAGHAAPAIAPLSLSHASSQLELDKIPFCSKSITTNCKKRRSNGLLIIIGAAALGAAVALTAGDAASSVSP